MAMKKIHLNSTNQLILGFLTGSRGKIAEHAMFLMCISSLILGPNFQVCSKSLPLPSYNRSSCILRWCRLEWSFWSKWWWILGLFWGFEEGFITALALEYCERKEITKMKRDKKLKNNNTQDFSPEFEANLFVIAKMYLYGGITSPACVWGNINQLQWSLFIGTLGVGEHRASRPSFAKSP